MVQHPVDGAVLAAVAEKRQPVMRVWPVTVVEVVGGDCIATISR